MLTSPIHDSVKKEKRNEKYTVFLRRDWPNQTPLVDCQKIYANAVLEAKNLRQKHEACCDPHLRQKCVNAMKFDKSNIKKRVLVAEF